MTPRAAHLARRLTLAHRSPRRGFPRLIFEPGTLADYRTLAAFHYRAGNPPGGSRIWVLRRRATRRGHPARALGSTREIVGVIAVSRPVLNGPWRRAAWPGVFDTGDRRADARAINRNLRVISRVVVDPRYRALGLAARLVRSYLRRPLTPCTEAIAAMAAVSPFFERAGMRRINRSPPRRQARLARALQRAGIQPDELAAPWLIRGPLRRKIAPSLRAWAADSRATRARAAGTLDPLMRLAACALRGSLVYVSQTRATRAFARTVRSQRNRL